MTHRSRCCSLGLAAALLLSASAAAAAEPSNPVEFNRRRELLRRFNDQEQLRLQQQRQCVDRAATGGDLDRCSSTFAPAWHHGMGGWGCPMW